MGSVFFFTGVGGAAAVHMDETIAATVAPAVLAGTAAGDAVGVTVPADNIRCWGATPGPSNERNWRRMSPGDICLIYSISGQIDRWGTVLAKAHDPVAATRLWGSDASGDTWEWMYFLDVQAFPTPVPLSRIHTDLGYSSSWTPQGFAYVQADRQAQVAKDFGSPEAWIASLITGTASGGAGISGPVATAVLSKPFNPGSHGTVALSGGNYSGPDPDVLSAGLNAHRETVKLLAAAVTATGARASEPVPPAPNYDLSWPSGPTTVWIAEIKSLTPHNEIHQLRLGLGQLLEFLHVHRTIDPATVYRGVLVTSAPPTDPDRWRDVCASCGIELVTGPADYLRVGL